MYYTYIKLHTYSTCTYLFVFIYIVTPHAVPQSVKLVSDEPQVSLLIGTLWARDHASQNHEAG